MRKLQSVFGAVVALLLAIATALAQSFPTRPITLVVPYPAGGPTDVVARVLAERMRVPLGQPVIVENVTGGSGNIGVGKVVRAAPDGYTLSIGNNGSHVLNAALYTLNFDILKDFAPVALLTSNPQIVVTRKTLPANDLKELVAWLRANPDKATAGSAGAVATVSIAFFQQKTDTRLVVVPYRGAAPAAQDLMGGQIDLMFDQASNALPQIRAGAIKAFAVTADSRLTIAPEIPTVDEQGLPGFHISLWSALWAPKGTPADAIRRLGAAAMDALADAAARTRLADLGQEIFPRAQQTPEALAAFQQAEIAKWWPIIRAAGMTTQ
jgi:tripartite-type tricarboxylate transporter receptor subunit TctC